MVRAATSLVTRRATNQATRPVTRPATRPATSLARAGKGASLANQADGWTLLTSSTRLAYTEWAVSLYLACLLARESTSDIVVAVFHHDGPFDALVPHRNRQTSRRAPMQAFPKDSLNNSLGGAGPLDKNPDHKTFLGISNDEAFRDFAGAARRKDAYTFKKPSSAEPNIFDPVARGAVVHGDESYGLGTSTFLEGTPATKTTIARQTAEQQQEIADGGLQRKKSLAQRFRSINRGQRDPGSMGRNINADGVYSRRSPGAGPPGSSSGEANPFFAEYSKGEDTITVRRRDGATSPMSPPAIPRRLSFEPLERRATTDGTTPTGEISPPPKPTGILGRMKSLKGGRRSKDPEPANGAKPETVIPGTAV